MTAEKLQSRARAMVALFAVCLALAAGGCASGANAPGEVDRAFDAKSRRWVSTMTPIEIDEVKPEAKLMLGARVEQVEIDTADGELLTSWVELEFVVTTRLERNTEYTRVQAGKKVETEGEMQLIGQSWPHLNCRSASMRADGAPIQLTPADLEGERAAYEGRVINEDGRAAALEETIRGRIPPAELAQVLGARRSRGDLCGTRFELSAGERKDLGELLAVTSRSPLTPVVAPPAASDEPLVAPADATGGTRRIRPPVRQRTVAPPKGPQGSAPPAVSPTPTVGRRPVAAPAAKAAPAPAAAPTRRTPSRAGSRPVVRGQHSRVTSPGAPAVAPAPAAGQPAPTAPTTATVVPPAPPAAAVPAAPAVPVAPEAVDPFAPESP
jgi:hypothetical protein